MEHRAKNKVQTCCVRNCNNKSGRRHRFPKNQPETVLCQEREEDWKYVQFLHLISFRRVQVSIIKFLIFIKNLWNNWRNCFGPKQNEKSRFRAFSGENLWAKQINILVKHLATPCLVYRQRVHNLNQYGRRSGLKVSGKLS